MEMESIIRSLENKTILVTGATGFLAKILVEKIVRIQPNIKQLFLLVRASDTNSALHRLHSEVIEKELFNVLKEKYGTSLQTFISEKVTPVAGDASLEKFGVTDLDLLNRMRREVDVVVNSAATTNFDERYDVALAINTVGVEHVCNFVNDSSKVKLLLHVSTAYVSGGKAGIIWETPLRMGETLNGRNNIDTKEEKKVAQERYRQLTLEKADEEAIAYAMKDLGIQRAKLHGWPNTYVLTKAMGEMLVLEALRQDVSLVILRPTIITSTYKEPFPGWIEGIKTVDSFIAAYARGRTSCFLAGNENVLDIIPADMVVNAMIVAMVSHMNQPYSKAIYHVGSSMSNPITCSTFKDYLIDYFAKHPLINKQGNLIKANKRVTILGSIPSFYMYMVIHYMIPLKILEFSNVILRRASNASYMDANRKIKIAFRLAELFGPFILNNSIYDDTNLRKLHNIVRNNAKAEMETFFLDLKSLNWEDYIKNTHIPGLVKYAFKK